MRGGSESFLIKDSAFYQSKMTAALEPGTITVYEELRAHVWRSRARGSRKMRAEIRKGRLSSSLLRQTIADSTGFSTKTVQRRINDLREIGWIRTESDQPLGNALVYELGYVVPGGVEVFYADIDCREFCLHLEEVAERTEEEVYQLLVVERVRLAKEWFTQKNRAAPQQGGRGSQSPTPRVTESLEAPGRGSQSPSLIDNPSGERIDKSEECPGGCAPGTQTGPEPKHWAAPPDNKRRRRRQPSNSNVEQQNINNQEQKEDCATFAIDTEEAPGGDKRFAGAGDAAARGKSKADSQVVRNAKCGLKAHRTERLEKITENESRQENFKGRHYPPTVVKAARQAWDTYKDEIEARDKGFVVPAWKAKGNTKSRGQVLELVEMYGGELTEQALRYVVRHWDKIGERFFKNSPGGVPNLGRLFALHEQLFREALIWGRHREVLEEWDAWFKAHEDDDETPPSDLRERHGQARTALESLGLGG